MRLTLFFLITLTCVTNFTANAEPIPIHLGEWSFTDHLSYFRSGANFDNAGTNTSGLPLGGYYSLLHNQFSASYDAFKDWRFHASTGFGYAIGNNSNTTYSGFAMTEVSGGAQYWFKRRSWALVPSFQAAFPFKRVTFDTNDSLVNEGSAWLEPGAWGVLYLRPVNVYGYLGYRHQDGGRAGLLMSEAGVSYRFPSSRIRGGMRGQTAVVNDTHTGDQEHIRNVVTSRVDAGSFKFYSVNPTLYEVYAEMDWIVTRQWEVGAGGAYTVYGAHAAHGWTALAMARFRIPSEKVRSSGRRYVDPISPTYDRFEPEEENYDQMLFKEVKPDVDESAPDRPRRAKPLRPRNNKSIDQLMRDTEKSLEK